MVFSSISIMASYLPTIYIIKYMYAKLHIVCTIHKGMNRTECFEIKEKYGDDAYYIALEMLEKDRIVEHWNSQANVAKYHIKQNNEKIGNLMIKLERAKTEATS
jgi:hypothetical protein